MVQEVRRKFTEAKKQLRSNKYAMLYPARLRVVDGKPRFCDTAPEVLGFCKQRIKESRRSPERSSGHSSPDRHLEPSAELFPEE